MVYHFLVSLDMQGFVGTGGSGYSQMNLSLYFKWVLFRMHFSTINILWSVVHINGYRETVNSWTEHINTTSTYLFGNWPTTASRQDEQQGQISSQSTCGVEFPFILNVLYISVKHCYPTTILNRVKDHNINIHCQNLKSQLKIRVVLNFDIRTLPICQWCSRCKRNPHDFCIQCPQITTKHMQENSSREPNSCLASQVLPSFKYLWVKKTKQKEVTRSQKETINKFIKLEYILTFSISAASLRRCATCSDSFKSSSTWSDLYKWVTSSDWRLSFTKLTRKCITAFGTLSWIDLRTM